MAHGLIACRLQDPGNLGTLIRPQTGLDSAGCSSPRTRSIRGMPKPFKPPWVPSFGFPLWKLRWIFCTSFRAFSPRNAGNASFNHPVDERLDMGGVRVAWLRGGRPSFLIRSRAHSARRTAESLNAGVASSIVCAEVARVKTGV